MAVPILRVDSKISRIRLCNTDATEIGLKRHWVFRSLPRYVFGAATFLEEKTGSFRFSELARIRKSHLGTSDFDAVSSSTARAQTHPEGFPPKGMENPRTKKTVK